MRNRCRQMTKHIDAPSLNFRLHKLRLSTPQSPRIQLRVEPLTASIGAELVGVNLARAAHDDGLFSEIRSLLLKHKVLFLRDQDISRADHVAFARRFGELEDHPVAGSHPEHPGLVQIYKRPDQPVDRYENA